MKNFEKKVRIESAIQLIGKNEVLQYVPEAEYEKIKEVDPSPTFALMSAGHVGESTGDMYTDLKSKTSAGVEWFKQVWPLKAIKELTNRLSEDKPSVYEAHDTDREFRVSVGSVLAGTKRVIDGVTHAVAVTYINNWNVRGRLESGSIDSCSIEARCVFERDENEYNWNVSEVKDVTGLAIFSSKDNAPGFKNASVMAVVAAMAKEDEKARRKDMELTIEQVRQFIEERAVNPTDLFSQRTILQDKSVSDALENDIEVKTKELKEKKAELEKQLGEYKKKDANSKISGLVKGSDKLKNEYNNVVDYIANTIDLDLSSIEDEKKQQEAVDAAIDKQLKLMQEAGFKTKGERKEDKTPGKEDKKTSEKTEDKTEEEEELVEEGDYTSPKNNELIPK